MSEQESWLPQTPVSWEADGTLGQIIAEHAGMVYGTARRVLGNDANAADVVQETFFQFARNAHRIQGSIAGWLHRVATRRSLDFIRQESSRRRREEEYVSSGLEPAETWRELEPVLDEALDDLPEDQRELLVLRFLRGQSTVQIALDHGWSQSKASRRIAAALAGLREKLRARGIAVSLVCLGSVLAQTVQAAPAEVLLSLGKLALVHSAAHAPPVSFLASWIPAGPWGQAGLAAASVAVIAGSAWLAGIGPGFFNGSPSEVPLPALQAAPNPAMPQSPTKPEETVANSLKGNSARVVQADLPRLAGTRNAAYQVGAGGAAGGRAASTQGAASQVKAAGGLNRTAAAQTGVFASPMIPAAFSGSGVSSSMRVESFVGADGTTVVRSNFAFHQSQFSSGNGAPLPPLSTPSTRLATQPPASWRGPVRMTIQGGGNGGGAAGGGVALGGGASGVGVPPRVNLPSTNAVVHP